MSRLVASREGPARKYYRPTPAGYAALRVAIADWSSLAEVVTPALAHSIPVQPLPPREEDLP